MNDRTILLGVSVLIADLFLIFAGVFNQLDQSYGYYVFDGILVLGIAIGVVGVFSAAPRPKIVSAVG